ncbi:MAG: geranylgeranyl reductase family protein, partial [Candidatus Geothermarchaeales archaeon]
EAGAKVLAVDRRKEIGIPIQCGEFMPTPEEMKDLLPNLEHVGNLSYPETVVLNKTRHLTIISPAGKRYTFGFESDILDREKFDKILTQKLVSHGGQLNIKSTGRLLSQGNGALDVAVQRKGDTQRVRSSMVVAADGARSRTATQAGLKILSSPYDLSPVLQQVMGGVETEEDTTEMYFGKDYSPGGFAWIIPRGDGLANVGLGIRTPFTQKGVTITDYLDRFIRKHPLASKKLRKASAMSVVGGLVPCGGAIPRTYAKGVLVAGDSAGHVLASVGAGIPLAVVSGAIAGEVAAQSALSGEPPLSTYEIQWKREMGREIANSLRIRELGDMAMKKDSWMERMLKVLGQQGISELIHCRIPSRLRYATRLLRSVVGP